MVFYIFYLYFQSGDLDLKMLTVGRDPIDQPPDIPVEGIVILPGKDELKGVLHLVQGSRALDPPAVF